MKKKYSSIKFLVFTLLLFVVYADCSKAQQYSTIHWLHGIPQSTYSNPAFTTDANLYIGMPGASSMYFGFTNSGFRIDDLLRQRSDGSLYIDDDNMLSKLNKNNFIGLDYHHEVLAVGYKYMGNYFSLNYTEKASVRFKYPKDFMTLLIKGNNYFREKNRNAKLAGFGINASHYSELGLGFSRNWLDELSAGARLKLLFGNANINFDKTNMSLFTHEDTYAIHLKTDVLINSSTPNIILDAEGNIEDWSIDENDDFYVNDYFTNTKNFGFAIDLGGDYEIDDRFSVALSVIDLGFISWKSDVNNLSIKGDIDYRGLDLDVFLDEYNDEDFEEILLDSINDFLETKQTYKNYRTMLPTKILLSGVFNISDIHKAGALIRGEIFDGGFYPSYTLAYSIQPIPQIGASLSYSIIHNNFANLGFGVHLNLYPFQFYLVTDNFLPAFRPHTIQTTTMQVGINWVIDYMYHDNIRPLYSW